jgi:transposase-like protein
MIAAVDMTTADPNTLRDDVEVPAKARRRRFTAKYKLDVLREADACKEPGALGALLRRKGLYSSHLATWRDQREAGELAGLAPKKRGRKPAPAPDPRDAKISELERQITRLTARAERAEALVEVQKKLSQLLGTTFESEKP